ncbi:MAG: hypothetical protein AAF800_09335 [Planctomycetota bacterium]
MKKINVNLIGLVLLVVAFVLSLGMVLTRPGAGGGVGDGRKTVVRLMHWQLEPGYRQAMQRVMDEYNALPHVAAANIEMQQLDVTERVYAQVLNVHAVSGTAPDLCERGMSAAVRGVGVAQFFDALGDVVNGTNRYNAPEYLPEGLDPGLVDALHNGAWRETLLDGMQGGWVTELQNYYAVPTSFFGDVKVYYNEPLFAAAKQKLREAAAAEPRPAWFDRLFRAENAGLVTGYVTDTPALRAWIEGNDEPGTLGRLMMVCAAIEAIAAERGDNQLVAIAGSSYTDQMFANRYMVPFLSGYAEPLNLNHDNHVSAAESWLAWRAGHWDFDDPHVVAYFDCVRAICDYFPAGFLGLDREQARRRFVNEQAGLIVTGAWDAKSLFDAAQGTVVDEDNPALPGEPVTEFRGQTYKNHRFAVSVMDFPMPGPGERWHEYVGPPASSAQSNGGATYMVYQRSPNKAWAIDFLKFLTSYRVNQQFNRDAEWLPITIGTTPNPQLFPFMPQPEGFAKGDRLNFHFGAGNLGTRFVGQFKKFLSGDVDYDEFASTVRAAAADDRTGAERVYFDAWQNNQDRVRAVDSLIAVQSARQLLLGEGDDATPKLNAALRQSALMHNATLLRSHWHREFPDEPFPEF